MVDQKESQTAVSCFSDGSQNDASGERWPQPNDRDNKPIRVIEGEGVAKRIVLNSAHDAFAGDYVAALSPLQPSKLDKAQAITDAHSVSNTPLTC